MPNICWRRVIDVPSRDLPTMIALLSQLAERERLDSHGIAIGRVVDYTADIEVFDTDTGSAVLVWTATFPVTTADEDEVRDVGVAVFNDSVEQIGREIDSADVTLEQAS